MPNQRRARFAFEFEDVFPEDDEMARYVMRLSTGLGDLRTVGRHVIRKRQTNAQRTYFVRFMASHLHELALILEPSDTSIVPDVETFLTALPRGNKPPRADIRKAHAAAVKALDRPMSKGRPLISVDGNRVTPRLRDDVKRLRNGFLQYADRSYSDRDLSAAIATLSGDRTGRTTYENPLYSRAEYADAVGITLMHPFDLSLVRQMHERIIGALGPVSTYIGLVEDAWLWKQAPGVVMVTLPGRKPRPLR